MTLGQAIVEASKRQGVAPAQIGAWTNRSTEGVRRWLHDKSVIPGDCLEILRRRLTDLPGLLDAREI